LEAQPDDLVALNNLANLLLTAEPAEALSLARRAHDAVPGNAQIADTLGGGVVGE
jgi:hypothetical protein